MTVSEKDFQELYINGGVPTQADNGVPQTPPVEATPPAEVVPPTPEAVPSTGSIDEIAQLAAETPAEVPAETPPTETTTTEDVIPPTETTTPTGEVSGEELQRMLDALSTDAQAWAETTQEIKTAAEDIKKSVDTGDTESQKKIDDMIAKVVELETKDQTNQKTIEILKSEYDKVLGDKLNLEYGSANDSKLATMINEIPELKDIISANMLMQWNKAWAKDTLIQAYKSALENLTWQSFDSIVAAKKVDEVSALSAWQDAWTETPTATGDTMYVA